MFVWTPALEALCPPFRGEGTPVVSAPLADKKLFAAASIKATNYTPRDSLVAFWKTGEGNYADEADSLLLACSTKGGAAREKLVHGGVDRWFERFGAAGALETFLREYFAAHPELAPAALEPFVKSKKKKIRETAASLLA